MSVWADSHFPETKAKAGWEIESGSVSFRKAGLASGGRNKK